MDMETYQEKAQLTAVYPKPGTDQGLAYCALGLVGEAGEVANKVKKILRGDVRNKTEEMDMREKIIDELGDTLWYLAIGADECGYSLNEVAERNLNKLAKRAKEGKLKGSGDKR